MANIDFSQLTDTELASLHLHANAFYGDPEKYINTPEYKEIYQKIIAEMQRRAKVN
mgnify:CR=1 FL=1